MKRLRNSIALFIAAQLISVAAMGQDTLRTLSKDQFISIVRSYHPVVKQANLRVKRAQSEVLMSRGLFDPYLSGNFDRKTFDGKLYYSYFNPQIVIPTWYGIDIKAGTENITGSRVTSEATLGKTSYAGVSLATNSLLFDERRAILLQAKSTVGQTEAEREITVNDLMQEAINNYWEWVQAYRKYIVVSELIRVNEDRFDFVKLEYEQGNRPAIDTTEALTQLQNFYLQQSAAWLYFQKAGYELANYLWVDNNVPVNWDETILPDAAAMNTEPEMPPLDALLAVAEAEHPKLRSLGYKMDILETERRLKAQSFIPKLNISANMLNKGYDVPETIERSLLENNYKIGADLKLPILYRKERGAYQAVKFKLQETDLEQDRTANQIRNKISSAYAEVVSLSQQIAIYEQAVANYERLLQGERMRYDIGESTLFLLNSRENKVLEAMQKLIELRAKYQQSYANLLWAAGELD